MPTSSRRSSVQDVPPSDPRMPRSAVAAAVLGIVGALPLAFLAVMAVALGGLTADTGPDPWSYLLVVAPIVEVWGALRLLWRRGWLLLVLAVVPVALITGGVIWAASRTEETTGSLGWPLLLLLFPVLAAAFALTPRVRRWEAGRPRRSRDR